MAAATLYRWHWLIDSRRLNRRYRTLAYQALAVVGVQHGARPSRGSDRDRSKRLDRIEELIWSDGQWERFGLKIQSILDEVIELNSVPDIKSAAASESFGEAVVDLTRRRYHQ